MSQPSRIHLFQGYGVELEYMIVDRDTLQIKPIADELLKHELGEYGSDFENGIITWSNELVLHVIELKSTRPEMNLNALEKGFAENVARINAILTKWNAMLLPSATHPFVDPEKETKLWPHDNNEVYEIYNKIFNCKGHGWSNLQSTHINLPFYDDEEFAKLHAAIRLVLPLIPALCASSPIVESKITGVLDTRLTYYRTNQAKIPSITGKVIPEAVFSKRNYLNSIYEKIKTDIAQYDPEGILNPIWVNSRGAIARFDRGSIEIRIVDSQECPAAELAVVSVIIETLKALVSGKFISHELQMKCKTDSLVSVFNKTIETGLSTPTEEEFAKLFNFSSNGTIVDLWNNIINHLIANGNSTLEKWKPELDVILKEGNLATRILKATGTNPSHEKIIETYRHLADCLAQNKMFYP